jgi:hypothetical protein
MKTVGTFQFILRFNPCPEKLFIEKHGFFHAQSGQYFLYFKVGLFAITVEAAESR